jgi:hypothetical protein
MDFSGFRVTQALTHKTISNQLIPISCGEVYNCQTLQTTLIFRHKVRTSRRFVFENIMDLDHVCSKRLDSAVLTADRNDQAAWSECAAASAATFQGRSSSMQLIG